MPHAYKDSKGRTWTLTIDVLGVKRLRGALGIDLIALVDDGFKGLGELTKDLVKFIEMLHVLSECETPGATEADLLRGMAGDLIAGATHAFEEELADFFQDPRTRGAFRGMIGAAQKVRERLLDQAEASLKSFDPEEAASRLRAEIGGRSSGAVPESAGLTPTP